MANECLQVFSLVLWIVVCALAGFLIGFSIAGPVRSFVRWARRKKQTRDRRSLWE